MTRPAVQRPVPDDLAFDLLKAVADHADDVGLKRTAALAEAAMDAWLRETRGIVPAPMPKRRPQIVGRPGVGRQPTD